MNRVRLNLNFLVRRFISKHFFSYFGIHYCHFGQFFAHKYILLSIFAFERKKLGN